MWKLSVRQDRGTEVELALPTGRRVGGRVAALGSALFGLLVQDLLFFVLFLAPLSVWFWKTASTSRTIRFSEPPGYITVEYYRWSTLGAWRFFKDQKQLPLGEADRMRSEYTQAIVQTSPRGAMVTDSYSIRLPDGSGNSFTLWEGDDPEVHRLLEQRIEDAAARHAARAA